MGSAARYITQFDSTTSMLYSLGKYFHGKGFAGAGIVPFVPDSLAGVLNYVPPKLREILYAWSGWLESLPPRKVNQIDQEEISEWVASQYPERKYPGVLIGSSNGAAIHLGAATDMPWLPQTFLMACRRKHMIHPDKMKEDVEWGKRIAGEILKRNPDLQVNQMHDPVQDRLMVSKMGYFRLKRLKLGKVYESFLTKSLEPRGTIYVLQCNYEWPVKKVGDRHSFQIGGLGDVTAEEYIEGSARIRDFLKKDHCNYSHWEVPTPDFLIPEAEWGFAEPLLEDIKRFAAEKSYYVIRISFDHPEVLSPFVADLYEDWYRRNEVVTPRRLVAECFPCTSPGAWLEPDPYLIGWPLTRGIQQKTSKDMFRRGTPLKKFSSC